MRKSIVSPTPAAPSSTVDLWRDLERIARVEISSEDPAFPIEHALGRGTTNSGWRAAVTGPQVIKLFFDEPQTIRRIHLHFVDRAAERSQEFALLVGTGQGVGSSAGAGAGASSGPGTDSALREVVRQQWNFSPQGTTEEVEDYTVDLTGITALELRIDPDRSHNPASSQSYASLQALKLA